MRVWIMILINSFKARLITNEKPEALVLARVNAKVLPVLEPNLQEKESNLIQWTGGLPWLEVYTTAPQFFAFYSYAHVWKNKTKY